MKNFSNLTTCRAPLAASANVMYEAEWFVAAKLPTSAGFILQSLTFGVRAWTAL
jgi:hypothetical protein